MNISPLAVVHPEAQIGQNVTIDPFAVIEKDVVIGDNCRIYILTPLSWMAHGLVKIAIFSRERSLPVSLKT